MRTTLHFLLTLVTFSLLAMSAETLGQEVILLPQWPDAAELEQFLKKSQVVKRVKLGKGITNSEKVTLELDGVLRHGVLKKIDKINDSWRAEVAAYEMDKLLGINMVPPTVMRRHRGRKASLQLWVDGVTMDDFEEAMPDIESWRQQVSIMWFFDDLIGNIDRHLNNGMVSPGYRLMLIDNSKTFRSTKELFNDLNSNGTGTHARFWCTEYDVKRRRYSTTYPWAIVEQLRSLSENDIKRSINKYIWGQARNFVFQRRNRILERFDMMDAGVFRKTRSLVLISFLFPTPKICGPGLRWR